jgi:hypothetical protein
MPNTGEEICAQLTSSLSSSFLVLFKTWWNVQTLYYLMLSNHLIQIPLSCQKWALKKMYLVYNIFNYQSIIPARESSFGSKPTAFVSLYMYFFVPFVCCSWKNSHWMRVNQYDLMDIKSILFPRHHISKSLV